MKSLTIEQLVMIKTLLNQELESPTEINMEMVVGTLEQLDNQIAQRPESEEDVNIYWEVK